MSATSGGCFYYPFGSATTCRLESPGQWPALAKTSKESLDPARLERPVSCLQGVGKSTERRLGALGIATVGGLLLHLPFRHEPPSRIAEVATLCLGDEVTLRVRVLSCALRETVRRRIKVLEALVCDDSGSVLATWYNQAYLEEAFRERPEVLLKGVLIRQRGATIFLVKRHEILSEDGESRHILGLVPVYPSTADLSVRTIRSVLHRAAPEARHLLDPLPAELKARHGFPGRAEAVLSCHFPESLREATQARERLAFEELLLLQMALLEQRGAETDARTAVALAPPGELSGSFLRNLAFVPTKAQTRVIEEIDGDLARAIAMRRLLHGDVGSGKTVIAAYSLLRAVEQQAQAALMAPTEVLADQHFLGLSPPLARLGVRMAVLKGSQSAGERRKVRKALAAGDIDIVVGTHALIQEGVRFKDLRVAVVDEQHRFGVKQRDAIIAPGVGQVTWPHTLHMSATPIPRTLSLTLYGDLDISVLDEMPPGRRPVRSRLVAPAQVGRMWEFVRGQLSGGRQAYVVCPLIEESESLETASARRTFEDLGRGELAGFRLRLLHGQLPSSDKAAAMAAFSAREADVLVSTSVIEVGVDVANASVMVILGARRFGLSQLHQLRGRVGRGVEESWCFLPVDTEEEAAIARLSLFVETSDGFELAEADLAARGEGQLFGERQSGIGDLQIASLIRDRRLLEEARVEAEGLLAADPSGASPIARWVKEAAHARFKEKIAWMDRA